MKRGRLWLENEKMNWATYLHSESERNLFHSILSSKNFLEEPREPPYGRKACSNCDSAKHPTRFTMASWRNRTETATVALPSGNRTNGKTSEKRKWQKESKMSSGTWLTAGNWFLHKADFFQTSYPLTVAQPHQSLGCIWCNSPITWLQHRRSHHIFTALGTPTLQNPKTQNPTCPSTFSKP